MTTDRLALVAVELAAVAIHPYPVGLVSYFRQSLRHTSTQLLLSETELEIVLALPMFLRFYLLGRAMMLHSRLFTDTASRSIGALNKVGGAFVIAVGAGLGTSRVEDSENPRQHCEVGGGGECEPSGRPGTDVPRFHTAGLRDVWWISEGD